MKALHLLVAVLTMSSAVLAVAGDEFDKDSRVAAPQGLLVRIQEKTNEVTIYKAAQVDQSIKKDAKAAQASIQNVAKAENLIANVKSVDLKKTTEFDRDRATSAWCYFYYGSYWAPRTYFNYYYNPYSYVSYNWGYQYNFGGYRNYWYWY